MSDRSIILFIASVMCFMWRVSYSQPDDMISLGPKHWELVPRVSICLLLALGVSYGVRVIIEFRRYGRDMDKKWRERVRKHIAKSMKQPLSNDSLARPTSENGRRGSHRRQEGHAVYKRPSTPSSTASASELTAAPPPDQLLPVLMREDGKLKMDQSPSGRLSPLSGLPATG